MKSSFLKINFLIVLIAVLGSLYFSEVLKYPPCVLCWYQRICIYPLLLIFGAAIWSEDSHYKIYALPLALTGLVISLYHNLLYYGVIAEELSPCTRELSCTSRQLELFGVVTIPLLSLLSFLLVVVLIICHSSESGAKNEK
jgi:disulfide bond formation protein DsbB